MRSPRGIRTVRAGRIQADEDPVRARRRCRCGCAPVDVPTLPKTSVLFGLPALMWLKALNASMRNLATMLSWMVNALVMAMSVLKNEGPTVSCWLRRCRCYPVPGTRTAARSRLRCEEAPVTRAAELRLETGEARLQVTGGVGTARCRCTTNAVLQFSGSPTPNVELIKADSEGQDRSTSSVVAQLIAADDFVGQLVDTGANCLPLPNGRS